MIGIYKITNPNGKIYIGESKDIDKRKNRYKLLRCKRQPAIYNSLKKYGFNNHKFEILEECEIKELKQKERYYQDLYNVLGENGLNCILTGYGDVKVIMSKKTKNKISKSNRGKSKNHSKQGIRNIKDSNSIPIIQINKEGIIKEWASSAEAARKLGIEKSGIIACTNNKNKTCKGSVWVKKSEFDLEKDYSYKFNRKKHRKQKKEFFIPFNTPSSKNSKRWTGKMLISSKAVMEWKKKTEDFWKDQKEEFRNSIFKKESPLKIGFHFVRNSKRKYDWVNPLQTIQDEMVKYEWILDDNITELIPFPYKKNGKYTTIDTKNPGVWIKIF